MPSEKLRYIKASSGPRVPLDLGELRERLLLLESKQMAEILWERLQSDDLLNRVIIISITLRSTNIDSEQLKAAVDYALHFPDWIRYSEKGHSQVLHEINKCIHYQADIGQLELASFIANYSITKAQSVAENFEDDWEWRSEIEGLKETLAKLAESS